MPTLIDRYVTAATQELPENRRADVAREIRIAIDELVNQRLDSGEPADLAIRESLNELGEPTSFAAAYEDSPRYLIGPGWYPTYIAVLKRVLPIVLIGLVLFSVLLDMADNPGENFRFTHVVSSTVDTAYDIGVQVLLWVTAGFIIAEHTIGPAGPKPRHPPWTVDDLPELPAPRQIGLRDTLLEIGVLLAAGVLVIVQHVRGAGWEIGPESSPSTKDLPVLNPDLANGWAIAFFGLLAISIATSIARYRQGTWTRTIFRISIVDDLLWIAFVSILAATKPIFNVELMRQTDAFDNIWAAGDSANLSLAAVIIAISAWSIWEAWNGHREYRQSPP